VAPLRQWPGFTLEELERELGSRTRALEALGWFYKLPRLPEALPDTVPGVSHRVWRPFRERTGLVRARVAERSVSPDGTVKYAVELAGRSVETVRIPSRGRSTVCVSSQAGCTRSCTFCATKELGFLRQLRAEEMVAQYLVARAEAPPEAPARNVVFMGMGEPLDNVDEVLRAVTILTQSPLPQLRAESVTVSTSGVVPGMRRFLSESKASLALSLNATTDAVREQLMPHTKSWPIAALVEALREGHRREPGRGFFIGYVLFDGVNDTDLDVERLVALFRDLPARINLIPWNPWPGTRLRATPHGRVLDFHRAVVARGQRCLVRWPRGQQIAAACGQLVLSRDASGFQPPG
jgi:23S rRNA (adenine2503-C2)-methyltransferase